MLGTKEICALLLAGGVGAGSVVGVQQVKAVVQKAAARKAPAPKAQKPVSRNLPQIELNGCPTIAGSMGSGIAGLAPLPSFESLAPGSNGGPGPQFAYGGPAMGIGYPVPGGGGGESGPSILPPTPVVPEPASWAMMVGGLGMIGLALRRNGGRAGFTSDRA